MSIPHRPKERGIVGLLQRFGALVTEAVRTLPAIASEWLNWLVTNLCFRCPKVSSRVT